MRRSLTITRGLNVDVELITRDCLLFGHQRKQNPKITKSTYVTSHVGQLAACDLQAIAGVRPYPRSLGGDVLYN